MLKVNGRAYDWGDVDFQMPGLNIQVQEVSYNDELEKEVVYGAGQKPRGYGEGNYQDRPEGRTGRQEPQGRHGLHHRQRHHPRRRESHLTTI